MAGEVDAKRLVVLVAFESDDSRCGSGRSKTTENLLALRKKSLKHIFFQISISCQWVLQSSISNGIAYKFSKIGYFELCDFLSNLAIYSLLTVVQGRPRMLQHLCEQTIVLTSWCPKWFWNPKVISVQIFVLR